MSKRSSFFSGATRVTPEKNELRLDTYVLDIYVLDTYVLDTYGLDTYGLDTYGLDTYGLDTYGLDMSSLVIPAVLPTPTLWLEFFSGIIDSVSRLVAQFVG